MRVICIETVRTENGCPQLTKGNIYTIFDQQTVIGFRRNGHRAEDGVYYKLAEIGSHALYHHSAFIQINEDQQDETEFERNYQKEKV
jgi:hypothetical protein